MPFRVKPDANDPRTTCLRCRGILELVSGYRSKSNLVAKCLRCKAGIGIPSQYTGRCKLYSDTTRNELIEESEIAGYIGPKCQGCINYNDATMNPRLHPLTLKRCPQLDTSYRPTRQEFESFFERFRDVDPQEAKGEARKRLSQLPSISLVPP